MFAEHPRGLGSAKSPKPGPRIQIPAQARSSGRLPASLYLPFLVFKGIGTSILPEAPIRASETDLTLLFPSSPHLTVGESGGLYLQIIWNPITSSSPPPLCSEATLSVTSLLFLLPHGLQTAYSQCPSRASPSQSVGKLKALVAHGPAIWPPLTSKARLLSPSLRSVCGYQGKTCPDAFPPAVLSS